MKQDIKHKYSLSQKYLNIHMAMIVAGLVGEDVQGLHIILIEFIVYSFLCMYRHTYTQVTTYLTVTVSYNHAVCCPGFSGISPHCTRMYMLTFLKKIIATVLFIAICNPTCANHGQCYHRSSSGTNYCECQPGFRGNYCQNGMAMIMYGNIKYNHP